jgi:iron complex outermembrane recepter protein
MKPNTPQNLPRWTWLPAGLVLASSLAVAQTVAPAPASPPVDPDAPIVLSEFRVDTTQDRGYLAANATSGTRLNMPIRDLPMQLEVITRDFIEDIGAVDFKEALQYTAGIVQDNVQSSNSFLFSPSGTGQATALGQDSPAINIRGYNTRFLLRNGFRIDQVADTLNVGRQEVVRGPQALLYGVSALAGIVNVDPRFPRATQQTTLRVGFGSEDYFRVEGYTTGPLLRNRNFRANYGVGAVHYEYSDYTDFNDRRRAIVMPAVDITLWDKTNLFVDAEAGKFKTSGTAFQDFDDNNPANLVNALGLRVSNRNLFNEIPKVARDVFGRDNAFRWSGGDNWTESDYYNITAQLTQKLFEDRLQILAGVNFNSTDTTRLGMDSSATALTLAGPRPTTAGEWTDAGVNPLNPAQRMWKSLSWQWNSPWTDKEILQTRVDATYNFDLFGNRQDILVGRQDVQVTQAQTGTAQVTTSTGAAGNRSYKAYNDLSYIKYQGEQMRPFRENKFWEWNTGHYAVYQGRLFNERLNLIGGYRWDRYMVRDVDYTYQKADATQPDSNVANWRRPENYDASANSAAGAVPKVEGYRFGGKVQYDENANYGFSYRVTDAINVFAMQGAGIFPNTGQRDGAGNPFQAEKTKGTDLGVKADLWRGENNSPKISLQAGVYRVERENGVYNVFWAPQPRSNNRNRDRGSGVPIGGRQATGTGPNAYSVYSSGYQDFQTNLPVTYLLPIAYVAAADLNHPRVTGAPQLNNLILVDYASLGTAAADPLRRAMNAAASDTGTRTALQAGGTGSGATGLFANNGYAFNRNSDVAYDDKSEGFDISVILNPLRNYTATFTYSWVKQEVTGGFGVVDQANSTEYDSWWNYMGIPLETRQGNLDESSYSFTGQVSGIRTIDTPEHSFNMWNRYEFTSGRLRGWDVGLGINWRNERQSEQLITNGLDARSGLANQRFRPPYKADTKLNGALGYRTRIGGKNVRFQLNVYNLLDDQKDEALGSSVLTVDAVGATVAPGTAGSRTITVPERAVLYYAPIAFRLTASVAF